MEKAYLINVGFVLKGRTAVTQERGEGSFSPRGGGTVFTGGHVIVTDRVNTRWRVPRGNEAEDMRSALTVT